MLLVLKVLSTGKLKPEDILLHFNVMYCLIWMLFFILMSVVLLIWSIVFPKYYFQFSNSIHNVIREGVCVCSNFIHNAIRTGVCGRGGVCYLLTSVRIKQHTYRACFAIWSIEDNWPDFIVFLMKPDDSLIILDMNYKFIYDNMWSIYCLTLYAKDFDKEYYMYSKLSM